MNPHDLIKAAPEIAKGAGALAAAIPFTAIVKRMLGPAADELAERWRDSVRLYRYWRQLECLQKAEKMALDAGFTPQAVPIKLLFPLLEGASLEEDEDLHTMWAALLANAASPDHADKVRPSFIAILKQMSPDDAAVLNWMYDNLRIPPCGIASFDPFLNCTFSADKLEEGYRSIIGPPSYAGFLTCLGSLQASQLMQFRFDTVETHTALASYSLTVHGYSFVSACRPPKRKS